MTKSQHNKWEKWERKINDLVSTYIKKLPLQETDISQEACNLPSVFMDVAKIRVAVMSETRAAKTTLDFVRFDTAARIRQELTDAGDKVTEARIHELTQADSELKAHADRYDRLTTLEKYVDYLLEAFRMKGYSLQVVARTQSHDGSVVARIADDVDAAAQVAQARKAKYQG